MKWEKWFDQLCTQLTNTWWEWHVCIVSQYWLNTHPRTFIQEHSYTHTRVFHSFSLSWRSRAWIGTNIRIHTLLIRQSLWLRNVYPRHIGQQLRYALTHSQNHMNKWKKLADMLWFLKTQAAIRCYQINLYKIMCLKIYVNHIIYWAQSRLRANSKWIYNVYQQ